MGGRRVAPKKQCSRSTSCLHTHACMLEQTHKHTCASMHTAQTHMRIHTHAYLLNLETDCSHADSRLIEMCIRNLHCHIFDKKKKSKCRERETREIGSGREMIHYRIPKHKKRNGCKSLVAPEPAEASLHSCLSVGKAGCIFSMDS